MVSVPKMAAGIVLSCSAAFAAAAPVFIGYDNVCGGADFDSAMFKNDDGTYLVTSFGEGDQALGAAQDLVAAGKCGQTGFQFPKNIALDSGGAPVESMLSQFFSVLPADSLDHVSNINRFSAWNDSLGNIFNPESAKWNLDPTGVAQVYGVKLIADNRVPEPWTLPLALAAAGVAGVTVARGRATSAVAPGHK